MKRFEGLSSITEPFRHTAVTLGNFDGVHRGHREILAKAIATARRIGGTSLVYTFFPHPVRLLAPESCPPLIQTIDQRLEAFEAVGIDACVIDAFSFNLAHVLPRDFFTKVIVSLLGASSVVVGYDFTFGLHRRGTTELLHQLGTEMGIDVAVVEAQFEGDLLISSTEIRNALLAGHVAHAAVLMGSPYTLRGEVVRGLGIGASIGVHTANIQAYNELVPADGVYITQTKTAPAEKPRFSVTSIGYNPTFPGRSRSIETHLIDFEGDLRGNVVDVMFYERLRGQIAFDSPETLKGQVARDIENARSYHEKHAL